MSYTQLKNINKPKWKYWIVFFVGCCLSHSILAAKASLILHPTQLFISESERNQSIRIINNGDATGVFEVSWVDYVMKPDGGFDVWAAEQLADWSLQKKVRYSPRRVTLAPGESQNVKIMIHRKAAPPESEYYSHLKVIIATANLDAEEEQEIAPDATSIEVKTRSGISVPVIWRNENISPHATIPEASFDLNKRQLKVRIERHSGVSTRGFIHVLASTNGANPKPVADPIHMVIYPSADHRILPISLTDSEVKRGDKLIVIYSKELESISPEIARHELQL